MPDVNHDFNPQLSWIDGDGPVKRQLAEHAKRSLELAAALRLATLTPEAIEAERFTAESNALAEENSLYAAARSASAHLVLPLEPGGARPLVEVSEATRDPRQLLRWWREEPLANPGVRLGRVGGLHALRVRRSRGGPSASRNGGL